MFIEIGYVLWLSEKGYILEYVLEYVWVCKGIEVLEIIVWIEWLKCFKECVENW